MDPLNYIVGAGGTLILFLVTAVWRISENKLAALTIKLDATATDLAAHKLKIAEEYVSRENLREMEDRIVKAIGAISETQSKIFEELKGKADK